MLSIVDKYYPFVTHKNVPARAAWLNSDIFECMLWHDDTFDKAKISEYPLDWESAKRLRNKFVEATLSDSALVDRYNDGSTSYRMQTITT